jgi:isoleucyl-tRNA synthetase
LGQFTIEVPEYAGQSVVTLETNENILKDLGEKVFKVEEISHSYPHCWRCDTPLIYKAIDSYLVAVEKIKDQIAENNKNIYWMPGSIGKGRFAKLIEGAPDWNISRNRFWGTPLPVWICDDCKKVQVFGSAKEVEEASGEKITDLHLHFMDKVKVPCECGGKAHLSGEVLDCWFESGSMPYGQMHYPFENKEKFEHDFPADFIAEGIDQTRGWFYSLLVLSTALMGKESYENVVVNGTVLAEDGQKMSKKLQNYPDPEVLIDKYGADAMRYYLMGAPVVKAGDLSFSEKGVDEVVKSIILRLWNSYGFFVTYASLDKFEPKGKEESVNVLDKWLISVTNGLVQDVTAALEKYDIASAVKFLSEYIDELSNWYIRRSRKRFWKSEDDRDKNDAYETLYFALDSYIHLFCNN